ncbi:MAG: DUF6445 family protein [Croceibacterium sp.]
MASQIPFSVSHLGREGEPLVIIDDFTGHSAELERIGRAASYAPAEGYPGIRSRISSTYLGVRSALLQQVLAECFGLTRGARAESCSFSIVTKRPEELSQGQRRPHYDGSEAGLIALLHYIDDEDTGGTAFYRHRRTGFESIRPERVARFEEAVREDGQAFGEFPPSYFHGDDERYELIGEVAARPDRVVIYRGRLLHSGHIPTPPDPSAAPERGRLTINTFLIGHPI